MKHYSSSSKWHTARSALLGSTLAIILSCVLLAGTTWAWLTIQCTSAPVTLASANFGVELAITDGENTPVAPSEDGTWQLDAGTYTVTLTRTGTSAESVGFCGIRMGETEYRSPNLRAGNPFSFPLTVNSAVTLSYAPVWSDSAQSSAALISAGTGIHYTQGSE